MECGSKKYLKGVGLLGMSVDDMKEMLEKAGIEHLKSKNREYYCDLIKKALGDGILILEDGKISHSLKRGESPRSPKKDSKGKSKSSPTRSPKRGSKSDSPKKLSRGPLQRLSISKLDEKIIEDIIDNLERRGYSFMQLKSVRDCMSNTGYQFVDFLGRGSFGDVYKVENDRGERYAVKCFKGQKTAIVEVYYSSLLQHPHILGVLDFISVKGKCYMLMELADGDLVKSMSILNRKDKFKVIYQLGTALQYLHDAGCVHCDIRPQNILMFSKEPKLADPSLIKKIRDDPTFRRHAYDCQFASYNPPEYTLSMNGKYNAKYPKASDWRDEEYKVKSELWSFGMLCVDILIGEGYFASSGGLSSDNPIKDMKFNIKFLKNIVNRGAEDVLLELIPSLKLKDLSPQLIKIIATNLLDINPDSRDLNRFLENSLFDEYREAKVPYIPYRLSILNKNFDTNVVQRQIRNIYQLRERFNLPINIVTDSTDLYIQIAHLFAPSEYYVGMIACLSIVSYIHNYKLTVYTPKDLEDYQSKIITVTDKILNHTILFESLYDVMRDYEFSKIMYTRIATKDTLRYIEDTPSAYVASLR